VNLTGFTAEPIPLQELNSTDVLLQSGFWGALKSQFGHIPHAFTIRCGNAEFDLLVLERTIGKLFSLAYVPHGPVAHEFSLVTELPIILKKYLPFRCVFIRFDFPWSTKELTDAGVDLSGSFIKPDTDIQPPCTVLVDLTPEEENILGKMKSKTRYNIRLAERKGVEVVSGTIEDLPLWYEMYRETSERDRIAIHSYEYYHRLFSLGQTYNSRTPEIILLLAKIEGDIVAGNILALYGTQGVYLYGASRSVKRNYMPTYALQWFGMKLAKEKGCSEFDLFGIPPDPSPKHPMHGLYRFKTGFGGRIIRRTGSWDYPIRPLVYRIVTAAEKIRTYYYKRLRKK